MRIAIVGSRRRNSHDDMEQVVLLLNGLVQMFGDDLIVCSGGCPKGADKFAHDYCKRNEISFVEFPAVLSNLSDKSIYRDAYYARNVSVALFADRVYAQVSSDRTGGIENTIQHALKFGKMVYVMDSAGKLFREPLERPERSLSEFE